MVQKIFLSYDWHALVEFILSIQIETQQNNINCKISTEINRSKFLRNIRKTTTHQDSAEDIFLRFVCEAIGKNRSRKCVVRAKNDKRQESRYQCQECDVGLCVLPYFKKLLMLRRVRWSARHPLWSGRLGYPSSQWPVLGPRNPHKPHLLTIKLQSYKQSRFLEGPKISLVYCTSSLIAKKADVPCETAGFSPRTRTPMSQICRRLSPRILFINIGYNQWASRIVTLTFLPKSVNNESAFSVQEGYTHIELSS